MENKEQEVKEEKGYIIKTDLVTLEKVADIAFEAGVDGFLSGKAESVDLQGVLVKLFKEKKLRELLEVITGEKIDNIELEKAGYIIATFLQDMGQILRSVIGSMR